MKAPHTQQTKVFNASSRSVAEKTLNAMKGLSSREKRAALEIIKQRQRQGRLDSRWAANFVKVLTALKAQE